MDLPVFNIVPRLFTYAALLAWAITFVGLISAIGRSTVASLRC
jgi:hypothetical protein